MLLGFCLLGDFWLQFGFPCLWWVWETFILKLQINDDPDQWSQSPWGGSKVSVRSSSFGDSGSAQAENCCRRAAPVLIIIKQVWGLWSAANISQASKKEQCAWEMEETSKGNKCPQNRMCESLSHVQLFVTPWTAAHQAPPSIGFFQARYWTGLPFPSPGDLSWPRDWTRVSHIAGRLFTVWATRKVHVI